MPHREGDDPRNVLLNQMNKPFADYALDGAAMAVWEELVKVRDAVNGALEAARNEKKISRERRGSAASEHAIRFPLSANMCCVHLRNNLVVSQMLRNSKTNYEEKKT